MNKPTLDQSKPFAKDIIDLIEKIDACWCAQTSGDTVQLEVAAAALAMESERFSKRVAAHNRPPVKKVG